MFFVTFSLISGPRRPLKLKEKDTKNNNIYYILMDPKEAQQLASTPSHRYICFPNFARSCHSLTRLLNELPRERQTRRTNVLYVKQSVLNKSCQSDSDPQMPSLPCAHLVRTLCTSTTFAAGRFPKILASGSAPHKIGRNPLSQSSYIN